MAHKAVSKSHGAKSVEGVPSGVHSCLFMSHAPDRAVVGMSLLCGLVNCQTQANEGIGKTHDGSDIREPPHTANVRDLGKPTEIIKLCGLSMPTRLQEILADIKGTRCKGM